MAYKTRYYAQIERNGKTFLLEILEEGFTGSSKRIITLQTLTVGLSGSGNLTDGIVKSQLNFSAVDAPDLTTGTTFAGPWATLYTSDSLKYKIQLKEDGEIRWTGFLTPDSYAESLHYRPSISFVARDMLGNASNFVFDATGDANGMITAREVINGAFAASKCPMSLSWSNANGRMIADGLDVLDLKMNIEAFAGKNWCEAMQMVVESFGLQMRWVDGNTVGVFYLRDAHSVMSASGEIQFVNVSGFREIDPSVKEIIQTDDYMGSATIYDGMLKPNQLERDGSKWKFTAASGWVHSGAIYVGNQFEAQDEDLKQVQNRLFFSFSPEGATLAKNIPVSYTSDTIRVSFSLNNSIYKQDTNGLRIAEDIAVRHFVGVQYFITAMVGNETLFLNADGTFGSVYAFPIDTKSGKGADVVVDQVFVLPVGATMLQVSVANAKYIQSFDNDPSPALINDNYYLRIDNLAVSLAAGAKYNNFVTTTRLTGGNVSFTRQPKLVQAPAVISPKIITNGLYNAGNAAASAFRWSDESGTGRMSVALAKQWLNLYYQPFNVLSGSFRLLNGNEPRFSMRFDMDGLGTFLVTRGVYNVIAGFMENVSMRQVVAYSSLGITSTSEVGTGGTSVNSSSVSGAAPAVSGGGGGSSILDTLLIPHYDDGGNLVSLESTVDFWSQKNISAGGLAAGGGGLSWEDLGTSESEKKISAANLRLSSDGSVYADEQGYLHSAGGSGGGLTWADLGTNATKKKISGSYVYLSSEGHLGLDEFYAITIKSLPKASRTVIGGVKVGSGLSMASDGTLSTTGGGGDGVSQDYVDSHIAGKDVVSTTPTNGQAIVWDATNSRFKWQTISGGGGDPYELPTATTTRLGGIKVGSGLSITADGTLSSTGGGGTSGITEDYANGRYIRRDGTNQADEIITFAKGIRIGSSSAGVDITYDTANGAVKINGKAYTMGDFSGGGLSSGSGDSGVDIITSLSASSTNDQVLGARALYNILGDLETALNNLL